MIQRPSTFADIVRRLAPALPKGSPACGPLVASAVELDAAGGGQAGGGQAARGKASGSRRRPFWVIVHSITDAGVLLLHDRPIRSEQLALRITAAGGEVVQVLLSAAASHAQGDLYETSAEFLRAGLEVGRVA